ncbi:MAG: SIR2 family protein [Caulobacteraceae bacterium]|nr:SIR2 family protein [Caulobacteraceae bacterium]
MDIEELQDYPAIRQLAEALWRGRASVLVGAGFSRNAELASQDAPLPPLWNGLAEEMGRQLYGPGLSGAPPDPLRLAEEYRRFFGQAALDDFVRAHIPDLTWTPGNAHKLLLELPWSDVLTTNYDTLLERTAAETNNRSYEIVRQASDFTHAQSPRIIKLHGTVGLSEHFTIAEEDYRTYPSTHAAFVNFARQSFLENELCLLGFSGDDANFTQWTGWVRDHLGSSSRRIFLIGLLDLSGPKRKYLEARNIAPIDLSALVSNEEKSTRHAAAAVRFLEQLRTARPTPKWDWKPAQPESVAQPPDEFKRRQQDSSYAANLFRNAAKIWSADRMAYPGWLICPPNIRALFASQANEAPWPNPTTLAGLEDHERAQVLYELLWRTQTGLFRLNPAFCALITPYADPAKPCGLSKTHQLDFALALAVRARDDGAESEFSRWVGIIEEHAAPDSDLRAAAAYQRALWARHRGDIAMVEGIAAQVVGQDPIWGLRQATLLFELGQADKAEQIVTTTLADLRRRQRQDRNSLWIASRRAWAEWFARLVNQNRFIRTDPWKDEFRERECDPWQLIEHSEETLREAVEQQRADGVRIKPQFEAGHYRDSTNTIHLGGSGNSPETEFLRLVEDAGIPLRLEHVNVLGGCVQALAALMAQNEARDLRGLIRFIGSHNDPILDRYFGRVDVAGVPAVDRIAIVAKLKADIVYWHPRLRSGERWDFYAVERLRTVLEVLARFSACESSAQAKQTHLFALDLADNPRSLHFWLFEPLSRLLKFSVCAVAPRERPELVLRNLEFLTESEAGIVNVPHWPNPSEWLGIMKPLRPADDPHWAARVARLIDLAKGGSVDRSQAVLRLCYLAQRDQLTDAESALLAKALWSELDGGDPPLPHVARLYASTFRWLPAPPDIDIVSVLRQRIYNSTPDAIGADLLEALVNLADPQLAGRAMHPDEDEALRLFNQIVTWRKATFDHPLSAAFERSGQKRKSAAVGRALGEEISPALRIDDRTEERLSDLLRFIDEVDEPMALVGLPSFARALPSERGRIIDRLRRGLLAPESEVVNACVMAILAWLRVSPDDLPETLVERAVEAVERRHWPGLVRLLMCLNTLIRAGRLSGQHLQRLDAPLGDLIDETAYEIIDPAGPRAVSFSLVRRECVRLASALADSGTETSNAPKWLGIAPTDPLPEVRYALDEG